MKESAFIAAILCSSMAHLAAEAGPGPAVYLDRAGDASLRRTDTGAHGTVDPNTVLPDVIAVRVGGWVPTSPATEPYIGSYTDSTLADFVRIDIELLGLVNPPGPLGVTSWDYDPYRHGVSPLYGFVELDVDRDPDTGGELTNSAPLRYLANIARFGSAPSDAPLSRTALSRADIDYNFDTWPQYERSGTDFSVLFCGCAPVIVVSKTGNGDDIFDAGETWIVRGRFFERFSGYTPVSGMWGGAAFGAFDPLINARFSHSTVSDTTTVTIVFPISQVGAAALAGTAVQPLDALVSNQTSMEEAVLDLHLQPSVMPNATKVLASGWRTVPFDSIRHPQSWRVRTLVGTAYDWIEDSPYAWTDIGFGAIFADFDGDGYSGESDLDAFIAYINEEDASDGVIDNRVVLSPPGWTFSVYDVSGDFVVEYADWSYGRHPADVNHDDMVDAVDFLDFLAAFSDCDGRPTPCTSGAVLPDLNGDGLTDILDLLTFLDSFES